MIGLRIVLMLLTMAAISTFGTTALKSHSVPDSAMLPEMEFTIGRTGGNCHNCIWIASQGEITADTPERFLAFLGSHEYAQKYKYDIRLHSTGGDLRGALRLGILFRELGFDTQVDRTVRLHKPPECGGDGPPCDLTLAEPGECLGACVYALAGGVERRVSDEDRIGLRPLSVEWKSAVVDAENESSFAALLGYLRRMGISAEIADIARGTMPNKVSILDSNTLRRTGIVNIYWRVADWRIEPRSGGAIAVSDVAYGPNFAATATVFCRTDQEQRVLLTISLDVSSYAKVNPGSLPISGIYVVPKGNEEMIYSDSTDRWRWRFDEPQAQNGTFAITIDITEELKEFIASDGFHVVLDAAMSFHRFYPDIVTLTGMYFPIPRGSIPTLQLAQRNCV